MLHVRTLRDAFFGRYFNEFEKINTPIFIVFQIDKKHNNFDHFWYIYLTVLTNSYIDFFIHVRTALMVYLTPNFCFT